jgi:hypothetical protein
MTTDNTSSRQNQAEALQAFIHIEGPLELHAVLLALISQLESPRAVRVWEVETEGTPGASALLAHARNLQANARLPWVEKLLLRLRSRPVANRQRLLQSTRRVMQACGSMRPIDRLHWLAMRHQLGNQTSTSFSGAATVNWLELPDFTLHSLVLYSAFLSRLVPLDRTAATINTLGYEGWYASVMAPWKDRVGLPAPEQPADGDALVSALGALQELAWMQRPVLVRGWLDAAVAHSPRHRLTDMAADALRLSCVLLDSPMPPALAGRFLTLPV